jgi:hypothetical protein
VEDNKLRCPTAESSSLARWRTTRRSSPTATQARCGGGLRRRASCSPARVGAPMGLVLPCFLRGRRRGCDAAVGTPATSTVAPRQAPASLPRPPSVPFEFRASARERCLRLSDPRQPWRRLSYPFGFEGDGRGTGK